MTDKEKAILEAFCKMLKEQVDQRTKERMLIFCEGAVAMMNATRKETA